jgi:hypothetical protein
MTIEKCTKISKNKSNIIESIGFIAIAETIINQEQQING